MPQIYDMGPTALLPLRRKACWGFLSPKNIRRLWPGLNPRTWVLRASALPLEHRSRYEIMWKNIVEQDRPQMTIWRISIAFRISKATKTLSGYAILTAFPLRQWLNEHVSVLRYVCIDCLFDGSTWQFEGIRAKIITATENISIEIANVYLDGLFSSGNGLDRRRSYIVCVFTWVKIPHDSFTTVYGNWKPTKFRKILHSLSERIL